MSSALCISRGWLKTALRLSKSSDTIKDSDAISSAAAVAHGKPRYLQG